MINHFRKFLMLTALGMFIFSCDSPNRDTVAEEELATMTEEHEDAHHEDEHAHHDAEGPIELNDGEKWKVNEEMKPHVAAAEEEINRFVAEGDTDFDVLAEKLKGYNNELIESCTMEGKSHDELHKWLHPHLELVKEMAESGQEHGEEIVEKVKESFHTYHEHFE